MCFFFYSSDFQFYGFLLSSKATLWILIRLIEKWKSIVDKGEQFGVLLTGLSKAFNCLSHELLIAKLHAHGSELPALELIQSYLSDENNEPKSI